MTDESSSPARLLVADDHELIRGALRAMLADEPDLEVVGEATNGREALDLCRRMDPDLVLMDVRMPEMDGLEATRAIREERPGTIVLVVTAFEDPDHLLEAIKAGAAGYVLKHASAPDLLGAVRGALNGESPLNQDLAMRLLQRLTRKVEARRPFGETKNIRKSQKARPAAPLSPREMDVLTLLAAGKTNRQIAGELHLSLSTVKGHLEHIIAKLGASDRTQAAVRAIELGLLPARYDRPSQSPLVSKNGSDDPPKRVR